MPISTPKTSEVNNNIVAQIETQLNQTVASFPKSFIRVLSKALAGLYVILYKYIGFNGLQQFVKFASYEETEINGKKVRPLVEWGRLYGVPDRTAATQAQLLIDVTVNSQTGTLPAGTQLVNSDNGFTYITLSDVTLDAATKQATIKAVSDQSRNNGRGSAGNLDPGETLNFANPLANVARTATVVSQVVTAADAETIANYRNRIVNRIKKQPQGGALADFELWGIEVEGIINIYPYTSSTPGQIEVYVEATEASSGSPDGIPTSAQLQAVQDAIDQDDNGLATRRPASALVNTLAITRTGFDIEVNGLSVDNLASVKSDIEDAVKEHLKSREPFIPGISVLPRKDRISRPEVGGVVADIVNASGGIFTSLFIEQNGTDVELYSLGIGEKAKLSSITFV